MGTTPPNENPTSSVPHDPVEVSTVRAAEADTVRPSPSDSHSSWIDDARFAPGTMLADRYRIVGRIGRGGMGEVYRADDLKLGQSIALKFLPKGLVGDATWLRRFHDEVRIAREIAHPNICRVYDIGEVDGEHFITMEYVDGEDLSSLLRRIGRLPRDKAAQIARQLCAGIAAAHDRNVLHRDLKPANIMLDGRGHVRITDFGIAAIADQVDSKEKVRAGTPAYMAPEQIEGRGVSRRSDLYALGLVLYEVYTGREAFHANSVEQLRHMRRSGPPTTPSTIVDDMDPVVERVIMRCLENDPKDRPGSAIAVAAALPGGDPLAAALAAGETPSPEMIAESGEKGGLAPAVAVPCITAVLLIAVAAIVLAGATRALSLVPFDKPAQALADRTGEIVRDLGYPEKPADRAYGFHTATGYLKHVEETDDSVDRWDRLRRGRPAAIGFWYRTSPEPMDPTDVPGRVERDDPPFTTPGMVRADVDTEGRLLSFERVPPATRGNAGEAPAPDWPGLFTAAGLDIAQFEPADPVWTPPVYCDSRAAWLGTWGDPDATELRIEAGAAEGQPVYFDLIGPWRQPRGTPDPMETSDKVGAAIFITLTLLVPLAAALIVWRHVRAGRGDRRGAARLALYSFVAFMGAFAFSAHLALSLGQFDVLVRGFLAACGAAIVAWLLYLAIEPYARRHWPHAMVSWSRLLAGRLRDPLVGRDVLFGCLSGVTIFTVFPLGAAIMPLLGAPPPAPGLNADPDVLLGGRHIIGELFDAQTGIGLFIGAFVLLLLFRIGLRRRWLANGAFVLVIFSLFTGYDAGDPGWPVWWASAAVIAALILVTMTRFGLLSTLVMAFTVSIFFSFPATFDLSRWYAGSAMIGPLVVAALAGYGFWTSLAGRPIFRDSLSEAPA